MNGINTRLPNLEHLTLVFNESNLSTENGNECWRQIGEIRLLIENHLPLERLYVEKAYKNLENDLAKFKNLKKFSAVHCNNKMPTKSGTIYIDTHEWLQEVCNLN